MSIHAADALMGIFGFKRVADDEITLDNPPSLDDDSGSLNEGMEMEEVKNEGLEVERWNQAVFDLETAEEKTIDVIQSETLKEMQSVHNWIVRLNAADQEGGQDE